MSFFFFQWPFLFLFCRWWNTLYKTFCRAAKLCGWAYYFLLCQLHIGIASSHWKMLNWFLMFADNFLKPDYDGLNTRTSAWPSCRCALKRMHDICIPHSSKQKQSIWEMLHIVYCSINVHIKIIEMVFILKPDQRCFFTSVSRLGKGHRA